MSDRLKVLSNDLRSRKHRSNCSCVNDYELHALLALDKEDIPRILILMQMNSHDHELVEYVPKLRPMAGRSAMASSVVYVLEKRLEAGI